MITCNNNNDDIIIFIPSRNCCEQTEKLSLRYKLYFNKPSFKMSAWKQCKACLTGDIVAINRHPKGITI